MECPYCKEEIKDGAIKCKHCGSMLNGSPSPLSLNPKSKVTAGILALLLGGLGIHKFYLGAWGWGIVYILLIWTYIPMIMGLIEGIRYLTLSDEEFERKAAENKEPFSFVW